MPPRRFSRHTFTDGIGDLGPLRLTDREPFAFQALPDNRLHIVQAGETLWTLAARYFRSMERPSGLWWVIADYQPDPIIDPTLRLEPGSALIIPSERVVSERIFSERRRLE